MTMTDPRHTLGRSGEQIAAAHLERAGCTILARNWHYSQHGELDIVAQDGDEIVFVEVRARRGSLQPAIDAALESITPQKRARLLELAQAYRAEHGLEGTRWRVDVIAVAVQGQQHRLEVIRDALAW